VFLYIRTYNKTNTLQAQVGYFIKKYNGSFIDCGCNYGFYSFYVASLSNKNLVLSFEASEKTSKYFLKNIELNKFDNIKFFNKAVSDQDNIQVKFNESDNDWESSLSHDEFISSKEKTVKTVKLDSLLKNSFKNVPHMMKNIS